MSPKQKLTAKRILQPPHSPASSTASSSSSSSSSASSPNPSSSPVSSMKTLTMAISSLNGRSNVDGDEAHSDSDDSVSLDDDDDVDKLSPVSNVADGLRALDLHGKKLFGNVQRAKKPYKDMIIEALKSYDDSRGVSYVHVEKWIKQEYPDLMTGRFEQSLKKAIKVGIHDGIFVLANKQANFTGRLKYVSPVRKSESKLKGKPNLKKTLKSVKDKENKEPVLVKLKKKTKETLKESSDAEKEPDERHILDKKQKQKQKRKQMKDVETDPAKAAATKTQVKRKVSKKVSNDEQTSSTDHLEEPKKAVAKRTNGPSRKK